MTITLKKKVHLLTKVRPNGTIRTVEQEQRYIRILSNLSKEQEVRLSY